MSREQFKAKYLNNSLKLAFIGMSNIGKTWRSNDLVREKDFVKKAIDEQIAFELGLTDTREVADWLGWPNESDYQNKQKIYLQTEDKVTSSIAIPKKRNFVLDTTGSVVYLSPRTLFFLKENFLIIYARTPTKRVELMIKGFFSRPKPVIWGDVYNQQKNETIRQALQRSYRKLLRHRLDKYQELADIIIDIFPDKSKSTDDIWQEILNKLK